MPTNGNAGAAWSVYAARAGLGALIVMPVDAPEITRRECVVSGAELYLVDGLINHAGALVKAAVAERPGYQEVSTLKEPYRIEGKKTMGYEIAEQLGWRVPDVILYPAGGGVGLIGIHKAMLEMRELGWIGDKLPRLVAVQADRVHADRRRVRRRPRREHAWSRARTRWRSASTCPRRSATSWCSRPSGSPAGTAIAVTDEEILAELGELAAPRGRLGLPRGRGLLRRRAAAARARLDRRGRGGRRAEHRHRPEVPRHRERRRPDPRPGRGRARPLSTSRSVELRSGVASDHIKSSDLL